jgi:ribose/xylose/arabinose/galactoside ABC-type transport system permease subunit
VNRLTSWAAAPAARALGLLILVIIGASLFEPAALTSYGTTLGRVTDDGIVAIGLTIIIVAGELDLSVGSTMAVAGIVAVRASDHLILGAVAALAVGVVVGLVNAALVLRAGVNSFIATLGTMIALSGLALLLTNDNPVQLSDVSASIDFVRDYVGQFTLPTLIAAALALLTWLFLARTRVGREFYAVGGSRDAAIAANIPVGRRKALGFVLCAVFAAVAGLLDTIQQSSASPTLGQSVLLLAVAGAVVGGANLRGGEGSAIGAVMGSVALGGVDVALEFHGVNSSLENVLTGAILFIAVAANRQSINGLRLDLLARKIRRV